MGTYTMESIARLASCDFRLQEIILSAADFQSDITFNIIEGWHSDSEFCPTKTVTVQPVVGGATCNSTMAMAIGYLLGIAHSQRYTVDICPEVDKDYFIMSIVEAC